MYFTNFVAQFVGKDMFAWFVSKCCCTLSFRFLADKMIWHWPHQIATSACTKRKCVIASFRVGKFFSRHRCTGQREFNGNFQIFRSFRSTMINSNTSTSLLDFAFAEEAPFLCFVSTNVFDSCLLCVSIWMNKQKVCKYFEKNTQI